MSISPLRIQSLNDAPIAPDGEFVLYWMVMNRRGRYNLSLERAVEHATTFGKPLVVFEALRTGYRWASDRIHRFVLQGMDDNRSHFARTSATYCSYVEERHGDGAGLLEALADRAAVVVTDDFPCFFIPRMVNAAAVRATVRFEAVDSNGLLPMRATDQVFPTAYAFRRFLHRDLPDHLDDSPLEDPLDGVNLPPATIPRQILERWLDATDAPELAGLAIDHSVGPAAFDGGPRAASQALEAFISRLDRYGADRNRPEEEVTSGLSPYLHFGHLSAHEVFRSIVEREHWNPGQLAPTTKGNREGWWNMSSDAEAFLDQLITWRELGYNMSSKRSDYDQFESLPPWALTTLAEHAADPRVYVYTEDQFARALTHDPLWNAAQTQLVREGRMHNYLRMLWGKKILHWSESPREAARIMIELNNKYAVDGRNPNSYSGIFWVLGRYDRAWGPERPIFGKVRYMTSKNTARKINVKGYIARYGKGLEQEQLF